MTTRLHLAALLLTATAAGAQLHSPQVNLPHKQHPEDLSWLWPYTQPAPTGNENALIFDPHFKPFLAAHLTAPQSFWNAETKHPKPLAEVALEFLAVPGNVLAEDNRYLTADGCVQHFCPDRGLLWVDTGTPKPLVAFAAIDWISDNRATDDKHAAYTLWLFPNRALDLAHPPPALVRAITQWTARPSSGSQDLQNITRLIVVDPDGAAHPVAPTLFGAHNALPAETN